MRTFQGSSAADGWSRSSLRRSSLDINDRANTAVGLSACRPAGVAARLVSAVNAGEVPLMPEVAHITRCQFRGSLS